MTDFISLSCPSCGGKLQITKDIERFACENCGVEHVVRRSGGTVSLAPVEASLNKIGVGVDKTASELAINRLTKEIEELRLSKENNLADGEKKSRELELSLINPNMGSLGKFGIFLLVIGILGSLIAAGVSHTPSVLIETVIFGGIIAIIWRKHQNSIAESEKVNPEIQEKIQTVKDQTQARDMELNDLISEKEQELLKHKKSVKETSAL